MAHRAHPVVVAAGGGEDALKRERPALNGARPPFAPSHGAAYSESMKLVRPLLNLVVGLLLLVQSVAVASTGVAPLDAADPAADVAMAAMPCHGDTGSGTDQPSCCDADCPNMAACALGHIAAAPMQGFDAVVASQKVQPVSVMTPIVLAPSSLLRPPISSHA